jgi:hypothetical protein
MECAMPTTFREPPPRRLGATRFLHATDRTIAATDRTIAAPAASLSSLERFSAALAFAAQAHANQRRKGSSQEPYINHLIEVADLVIRSSGGADVDLAIAALLHDCLEDTGASAQALAARFGSRVADLVCENTDDMTLPKPERKAQRFARARTKSPDARLIKLADLLSNVRAVDAAPPAGWTRERRLSYLSDCREMLSRLAGFHPALEAELDEALGAAVADLRGTAPHPVRPLLPRAVGQDVHMLYVGHTGAGGAAPVDRIALAGAVSASFPSFTIIQAEAMVDGVFGPVLLVRVRSDSVDAVVALAQHLCVRFHQRFVGLEVQGSYVRIYADDTA